MQHHDMTLTHRNIEPPKSADCWLMEHESVGGGWAANAVAAAACLVHYQDHCAGWQQCRGRQPHRRRQRRDGGQGEEEVPVLAVLADMLLVTRRLCHAEPHKPCTHAPLGDHAGALAIADILCAHDVGRVGDMTQGISEEAKAAAPYPG